MSLQGFRGEVNDYSLQLARSNILRKVPRFIRNQADHLTYQAAGYGHLRAIIDNFTSHSESITCIETNEPFTFAIKLMGGVAINQLGKIDWVKLVEPPEDRSFVGISALNFHVDSVDTLVSRFETGNYNVQYDDSQPGVVAVRLNQHGQTVNFVERRLEDDTGEAVESGLAVPIHPRQLSEPEGVRSQES